MEFDEWRICMKSVENKAESVREVFSIGYVVFMYFKKIQKSLCFETTQ